MTSPALPVVRETAIDGVPVLWTPVPGPLTCALLFRVGRADEARPIAGITHLVEHLVLGDDLDPGYEIGGFVDVAHTVFTATGHPHEIVAFLARVCAGLAALPTDRLAHERGILQQEASERPLSIDGHLRFLRFGVRGHGLIDGDEAGLGWLDGETIDAWRASRFTRGNAVLAITGEPPADLRLDLPPGPRHGPIVPVPAPGVRPPMRATWERDGVGLSLVTERGAAASMLTGILERRLERTLRHGLGAVYDVAVDYAPLDPGHAHLLAYTESRAADAGRVEDAMAEEPARLAAEGPTAEELARELDGFERAFLDPLTGIGVLDACARYLLDGEPILQPEEAIARRRAVTPEIARDVARAALPSALLAGPADRPAPAGWADWAASAAAPVTGRAVPRAGRILGFGPRERLVVSAEGVTVVLPDGGTPTIRWADLVASEHAGEHDRRLLGADGTGLTIEAADWKDGAKVVDELDAHVDPLLVVCPEDSDRAGWAARIRGGRAV